MLGLECIFFFVQKLWHWGQMLFEGSRPHPWIRPWWSVVNFHIHGNSVGNTIFCVCIAFVVLKVAHFSCIFPAKKKTKQNKTQRKVVFVCLSFDQWYLKDFFKAVFTQVDANINCIVWWLWRQRQKTTRTAKFWRWRQILTWGLSAQALSPSVGGVKAKMSVKNRNVHSWRQPSWRQKHLTYVTNGQT